MGSSMQVTGKKSSLDLKYSPTDCYQPTTRDDITFLNPVDSELDASATVHWSRSFIRQTAEKLAAEANVWSSTR